MRTVHAHAHPAQSDESIEMLAALRRLIGLAERTNAIGLFAILTTPVFKFINWFCALCRLYPLQDLPVAEMKLTKWRTAQPAPR